ncbi:MAG TPA: tetratricopeptide repeat protein [Alphaproteobacteria bacterium]|nr:tetratricopeptide repeat protein [Alphaproteobacteria bacterium]
MNRAAKRQQKKLSRKAALKTRGQPPRPAGATARGAPADYNTQLIQKGLQLQMAGRAPEAEAIYRQILHSKPSHADANHLLGVLAKQSGDQAAAMELISKAIDSDRNQPMYHNNLGSVFGEMGRLEAAAASYRKAIALKPDFPDAHYNLAGVSAHFGRLDEAIAGYRKAISARPDYVDAHFKLAFVLHQAGRLDEAAASYQKTLALAPDYADAHANLGAIFRSIGRPNDAFAHCGTAVVLKPDFDPFWNGLAISLEAIRFTSADDDAFQILLQLLERPMVSPNLIARPILSALQSHPETARILALTGHTNGDAANTAIELAARLSGIPLLLRLLALSVINDQELEAWLTQIRHDLILTLAGEDRDAAPETDANTDAGIDRALPFLAALALHCFTNEYVFSETAEETAAVEDIQNRIGTLLTDGHAVPPALVAALGAYRPLYQQSWADDLLHQDWPGDMLEVIRRQIAEPREEKALAGQLPCLTPIENAVSISVRAQYEENPYPRWTKTTLESTPRSIQDVLQGPPLHFDMGAFDPIDAPEILVAGCGTGRHALTAAAIFAGARVLAVDLSLASLGYAARQTRALGFTNIEFAQADIMELGRLDRRFDLVESSGVLHHLGDPLAGWKVLVDRLRPGGFMKIALYSELAREPVVAARALIAKKGYAGTPEDIRRCREDIRQMAGDGNAVMAELAGLIDFYGLSMCRDLIFHVQEHRFTLPQIEAALATLGLEFLGFELGDLDAFRRFKTANPEPGATASLTKWHAFELENPRTFARMYQFWCRKP